ncbi:MAG TPA: molybdenum cofactor guanylyltransferase [Ilumatobacter sp.]
MTAGAVLCGGRSRRMGTDKAVVEVDGVAMAERVARTLEAAGCRPVVLVGGDVALLERFGRTTVADAWPGEGPLGGVLTALGAIGSDGVVVAACDLPWLDVATVRAVAGAGDAATPPVDVAVATTERLEPALAWWSGRALGRVTEIWEDGVRAIHEAIGRLTAVRVEVDPTALHNVNTAADLAAARPPPASSDG